MNKICEECLLNEVCKAEPNSEECDGKRFALYKGRKEIIDRISNKNYRKAMLESKCELLKIYARDDRWSSVARTVLDMVEMTCKWELSDELMEMANE